MWVLVKAEYNSSARLISSPPAHLGRSKKINLPNTSDFPRKKHLVWKVLNFGVVVKLD
jgi:hypothetical protein